MMLNLTVTVTGEYVDPLTRRVEVPQAGISGGNPGIVDVTTTESTLDFGDIAPGLVVLENLDEDNFVSWGFDTGSLPGRLLPNKVPTVIYVDSATIYVEADTATCRIKVTGYDA